MLNFDFLEKGLVIVSPTHVVHDFSRKIFFMLYSINRPNFIVRLPLLLDSYWELCVLQLLVNQVVMSEILK